MLGVELTLKEIIKIKCTPLKRKRIILKKN